MSSIVDYTDRSTCIILVTGAGAVLCELITKDSGLQDEYLRSDGIGRDFLKIDAGGLLINFVRETVKTN
jgi:3-oxoacyl-[acyl-carrier-protein] synthase-3